MTKRKPLPETVPCPVCGSTKANTDPPTPFDAPRRIWVAWYEHHRNCSITIMQGVGRTERKALEDLFRRHKG